MKIDFKKCVNCGSCIPFCPVNAIKNNAGQMIIDQKECVECYVCYRSGVCQTNALKKTKLTWPRILRHTFSSVEGIHKTGIPGRGTEEVKTNDVTGRYGYGEVGFTVDVGRPGMGTSFNDVEKITKALAKVGVKFEPKSPITILMKKMDQGTLPCEIKLEKILSCIIEFKVRESEFLKIIGVLNAVSNKVSTVFSVGCIIRVDQNGDIPLKNIMENEGVYYRPNCKINLGLAREKN